MNFLNSVINPNRLTVTDLQEKLILSLKNANLLYTGAAITVRRDSDNTTADFYADANGNLTNSSSQTLLQWGYGSSALYVTKWYDQSGKGNDATQTTTTLQPMIEPTNQLSMTFDGSTQYGRITSSYNTYNNVTALTLECWIKTTTTSSSTLGIVTKRAAYGLYLKNGYFYGGCSNVDGYNFSSGVLVNYGNWHYICMTFQSGETNGTNLYVDGVFKATGTLTSPGPSLNYFGIGAEIAGGSSPFAATFFNGSIDGVRLWNRVLTATEISQYYNRRISPDTPYLVGYWGLDEGSGTTLYDKVSGTNNLTLYGNTPIWSLSIPSPTSNKFLINFSTNRYMVLPNGTVPYNDNPYTIIAHHGNIVETSQQNTLISGGGMSLICGSSYSHSFAGGPAATGGVYSSNATVTIKYDHTNLYLYINGGLIASAADTPIALTNATNAIGTLGSNPTSSTYLFNGDIYSISIYGKALNDYMRRGLEKKMY